MVLVQLVDSNPVIFSKATNASNNQLKEMAWNKITDAFNATVATHPRKLEQLRGKWENLKKAARKRNTKIRMNNLKVEIHINQKIKISGGCYHYSYCLTAYLFSDWRRKTRFYTTR